ncbi:MAG: hypothetical protein [Caudoviricetes sp.]|nr:MAG: hypothetical protein [Caudoviricetes sp.]
MVTIFRYKTSPSSDNLASSKRSFLYGLRFITGCASHRLLSSLAGACWARIRSRIFPSRRRVFSHCAGRRCVFGPPCPGPQFPVHSVAGIVQPRHRFTARGGSRVDTGSSGSGSP